MKEKEPIAAFAEGMREHNRYAIWRYIILLLAWGGVSLMENDNADMWNILGTALWKILVAAFCGIHFHRMYLDTKGDQISSRLEEIMRPHHLDVKAYFSYIRNKQLFWQGILLVEGLVFSALSHSVSQAITTVIGVCIPTLVNLVEQTYFQYVVTHQKSTGRITGMALLRMILAALDCLTIVPLFLFMALSYTVVSGVLANFAGFDDNIVMIREYSTSSLIGILFGILFACILLIAAAGSEYFKKYTGVIFGLVFLMCAVQLVVDHFCYLDITETTITQSDFEGKSTYTFDQIAEYEYVSDEDERELYVTFSDGQKMKLYGYGQEAYSDAYTKKYEDEIRPFLEDLILQFQKAGAKERNTSSDR